ncbi:MAG: hypothetical protein WCF88_10170 [Candidatus Acidiferrales bacterium]
MDVISCSYFHLAFFEQQNFRAAPCAASQVASRFVPKKLPEIPEAFLSFVAGAFLPARTAPVRTEKRCTPPLPPKKQKLP